MSRVESRLLTSRMPWHANMTEANHLGAALIAKPHVFEGKVAKLFSAMNYYSDNPLTSVLLKMAREEEIGTSSWEWSLRGATTRPLVIVENVEPSGNTTLGKGCESFRLCFDEPWWKPGDIINPGTSNKKFQVRIQSVEGQQGSGYVYMVQLMTDDIKSYLPVQYVSRGTRWSKLFAQYEEGAVQSGSTQYSLPLTFMSKMSRYRKTYEVTGDAAMEVLAVKIPDSNGNYYSSWVQYAEVEYWMQWFREKEIGYWYSRNTSLVNGSTGRSVQTGPGIQELLEDSHIHYYSVLTARLIQEFLMDIFYARVKPGTKREIKAFTGEYGMIQFHNVVNDTLQKSGFITVVDDTFIQKTKSDYNSNALAYGYQFTKYIMANGSTLELIHNPLYDDRQINFEVDPLTGFPVESQRFTFLDFSGDGEKGNIKLMKKKNAMKLAYVGGLQTPYGPAKGNKLAAHSGDYYQMHVQDQCGVHIEDPTRCGELILSRS